MVWRPRSNSNTGRLLEAEQRQTLALSPERGKKKNWSTVSFSASSPRGAAGASVEGRSVNELRGDEWKKESRWREAAFPSAPAFPLLAGWKADGWRWAAPAEFGSPSSCTCLLARLLFFIYFFGFVSFFSLFLSDLRLPSLGSSCFSCRAGDKSLVSASCTKKNTIEKLQGSVWEWGVVCVFVCEGQRVRRGRCCVSIYNFL